MISRSVEHLVMFEADLDYPEALALTCWQGVSSRRFFRVAWPSADSEGPVVQ